MMDTAPAVPFLANLDDVNRVMHRLLLATLSHENKVTARDLEIAKIQKHHATAIDKAASEIALCEIQIHEYCVAHPFVEGEPKSVQLPNGLFGLRAPSRPALVPLNENCTWDLIAKRVKRLFGARKYFNKPAAPTIDKNGLKKAFGSDPEQLARCYLKLDDTETFYYELNRLAESDEVTATGNVAA